MLRVLEKGYRVPVKDRRWTPVGVSTAKAVMGMVALPAIVGTAVVLLIFLPLPATHAYARLGESSFWIAAAVGTWISRRRPTDNTRNLALGWADIALLLAVALLVRLMIGGITVGPQDERRRLIRSARRPHGWPSATWSGTGRPNYS